MSYRSELRDGWRMFLPYAREVVTRRRLVILLTLAPAVSIVVAAGIDVVVISTDADLDPVLTALAGGLLAGCLFSWILLAVWRPRLTEEQKFRGTSSMYAVQPAGADREIRAAYLEGREPRLTVPQRLAAADAARRARRLWPHWVLGSIGGATIVVPYALFAVAAWPTIAVFGGAFSLIVLWWSVPAGLVGLARTTAPIETAPEVPADLREDGRKRPQARKSLGTDHPDDYT